MFTMISSGALRRSVDGVGGERGAGRLPADLWTDLAQLSMLTEIKVDANGQSKVTPDDIQQLARLTRLETLGFTDVSRMTPRAPQLQRIATPYGRFRST